jgi:hypothetical protein
LVIVSTIPVFVTAFYLPYILFLVLALIMLMSLSFLREKPFVLAGLGGASLMVAITTLAYAGKIGYLDSWMRSRPLYMPGFIWSHLGSIMKKTAFLTESIMPPAGFIILCVVFLIYRKKYPLKSSLISVIFLGAISTLGILVYGYGTRVEGTYLLGPILTLSLGNLVLGLFINQIKEGVAEELQRDYIKAAAARGASLWNHLKRKILLIVLNTLKSQFALLLSLTIIVEKIYNLEGIGYLAWEYATQVADFVTVTWIMGLCFLLVWILNNLLDICIFFLSPPA